MKISQLVSIILIPVVEAGMDRQTRVFTQQASLSEFKLRNRRKMNYFFCRNRKLCNEAMNLSEPMLKVREKRLESLLHAGEKSVKVIMSRPCFCRHLLPCLTDLTDNIDLLFISNP
jgi:hypothetical protein